MLRIGVVSVVRRMTELSAKSVLWCLEMGRGRFSRGSCFGWGWYVCLTYVFFSHLLSVYLSFRAFEALLIFFFPFFFLYFVIIKKVFDFLGWECCEKVFFFFWLSWF